MLIRNGYSVPSPHSIPPDWSGGWTGGWIWVIGVLVVVLLVVAISRLSKK
jgi:hypothetical protein